MEIQKVDTETLVYYLRRSFFIGVATFSTCSNRPCETHARGGTYCKDCIRKELIRRGTSISVMENYFHLQDIKLNAMEKLYDIEQALLEQCDA